MFSDFAFTLPSWQGDGGLQSWKFNILQVYHFVSQGHEIKLIRFG